MTDPNNQYARDLVVKHLRRTLPYTWRDHVAQKRFNAETKTLMDADLARLDEALSNPLPTAGILSAALPSPTGGALGLALAASAMGFAKNPETATPTNIGLSLLGALPFFPAGSIKLAPALKLKDGRILPGKFGGMHFQILDDLKKVGAREDDILDDGFINDAGEYLTRKEAMQAAIKEAPDFKSTAIDKNRLLSEDLIQHHGLEPPWYE